MFPVRVPFVFTRVPFVFSIPHSCSLVFHPCSHLCGVLDLIIEDPKDKIRRDSFKRCRRRYILCEDYSVTTIFLWLTKVVLGVPMDPILNFLERGDRELSENVYF